MAVSLPTAISRLPSKTVSQLMSKIRKKKTSDTLTYSPEMLRESGRGGVLISLSGTVGAPQGACALEIFVSRENPACSFKAHASRAGGEARGRMPRSFLTYSLVTGCTGLDKTPLEKMGKHPSADQRLVCTSTSVGAIRNRSVKSQNPAVLLYGVWYNRKKYVSCPGGPNILSLTTVWGDLPYAAQELAHNTCLLLWTSRMLSLTNVEMPPICVILFFPSHSSSSKVHASSPEIALHHGKTENKKKTRTNKKKKCETPTDEPRGDWRTTGAERATARKINEVTRETASHN